MASLDKILELDAAPDPIGDERDILNLNGLSGVTSISFDIDFSPAIQAFDDFYQTVELMVSSSSWNWTPYPFTGI